MSFHTVISHCVTTSGQEIEYYQHSRRLPCSSSQLLPGPSSRGNHCLDVYYSRLDSPVFELYVSDTCVFCVCVCFFHSTLSVRSIQVVACGNRWLYSICSTVDRLFSVQGFYDWCFNEHSCICILVKIHIYFCCIIWGAKLQDCRVDVVKNFQCFHTNSRSHISAFYLLHIFTNI